MIFRHPIIGVMGSHAEAWHEYAEPLGRIIAQHDYHLLIGAGGGVMTSVAKSFVETRDREGFCLGLYPTASYNGSALSEEEFPNPYIEVPLVVPLDHKAQNDSTPYSRNLVNIMSSHAIVVLPGDHGTRNEVSMAIQYRKPLILFGKDEYFLKFPELPVRVSDIDEVREFLEKTTDQFRKNGK